MSNPTEHSTARFAPDNAAAAAAGPSPARTLCKPHPKGYRAKVGNKRFWLGRDAKAAQALLNHIVDEWTKVEHAAAMAGPGVIPAWPPSVLKRIVEKKQDQRSPELVRAAAAALDRVDPPAATLPASRGFLLGQPAAAAGLGGSGGVAAGSRLGLTAAIENYIDRRRDEMLAGQIQPSRLSLIHYSLARIRWVLPEQPISRIGPDELRGLVQFFLRRPVSENTGCPLGPQTVIETLYHARKLFEDLSERGLWSSPQPLIRVFAFRRDNLWTDSEREAMSQVKTFTLDELRTLWHAAGNGTRSQLYMALGLNCGFTQMEIATLRHAHLHLDGPKPYIQRFRHKTKVRSKWRLWPETVKLLRRHMTNSAVHDNVLMGRRGRMLVRNTEISRSDDIRANWNTIRTRVNVLIKRQKTAAAIAAAEADTEIQRSQSTADPKVLLAELSGQAEPDAGHAQKATAPGPFVPVRPLGFKFLRKTASNLIRRLENKDTAEVFLAHVDPTIGRAYHNPDYKRLNRGLRRLRLRIWPAIDADLPAGDVKKSS